MSCSPIPSHMWEPEQRSGLPGPGEGQRQSQDPRPLASVLSVSEDRRPTVCWERVHGVTMSFLSTLELTHPNQHCF